MVMPFQDEKMDAFYQTNIKKFLKTNLTIEAKRADDFTGNDVIVDTIYRELENSEFILCEITNNNKNVFYEIGYARAKNKELILMLQKGKKSEFFDIDHIRRIEYSISEPIPFQERLRDDILSIRGKR
jgi:nucleoside 2-deoxyribosyltransferase